MSDDAVVTGEADLRQAAIRIGPQIGLIADPTFAIVDAAHGDLAERLWLVADSGGGFDELLDALSTIGLKALGHLALAQIEAGGVRIVVRGAGCASVRQGARTHRLDAEDKHTWIEETFDDCSSFTLAIGELPTAVMPFRVRSAIVPADAVTWPADPKLQLAGVDVSTPDDRGIGVLEARIVASVHTGAAPDATGVGRSEGVHETDGASPIVQVPPPPPAPPPPPPQPVPPQPQPQQPAVSGSIDAIDSDRRESTTGPPPPTAADPVAPAGDSSQLAGSDPHDGFTTATPVDESIAQGGDHDGMTMSLADLRAMRAGDRSPASKPTAPPTEAPTVEADLCHLGHPNPPGFSTCRLCHADLPGRLTKIPRPRLGRITMSTGDSVELDRAAIIGRKPQVEGQLPGEMPQLVKIDAGHALSRSHLLVTLDGWSVIVQDLDSANGTTLTVPGGPPRDLVAGEQVILEHNAQLDLGGEVIATYDAHG